MPMPMPIAAGKSIVYDLWPFPSQMQQQQQQHLQRRRRLFYYYVAAVRRYLCLSVHVCVSVCCTCVYVVSSLCLFMWNAIITIICLIYDSIL